MPLTSFSNRRPAVYSVIIFRIRPRHLVAHRSGRVMLPPVGIDPIDEALDVVLTQAAAFMAARAKAGAGVNHEISERVVPCRLARVAEPPPTERALGHLTKSSAPREGKLGDK